MNNVMTQLIKYIIFCLSLVVLLASFYFQYALGLKPCPLCLMQRLCLGLITLMSLMVIYIKRPVFCWRLLWAQFVFVVFGVILASRQIWLQSLPAGQAPACMPDLSILIHYFPWQDVVHTMLWGAGDCAEVPWQGLGLSLAAWSLLYFVLVGIATLYLQVQSNRKRG